MLKDKVYDVLKWVAIIFLPAFAKLIEAVFIVWDIPYGKEIASTIISVQVFLGAILCIDSVIYNKKKTIDEKDGDTDE